MAYSGSTYGDISPRTAAYVVKDLLTVALPFLTFEKFGQSKPIPKNSTKSIKFRRYFLETTFTDMGGKFNEYEYYKTTNFNPTNHELTEGTTPSATKLKALDISATLKQYGDRTEVSDVIMDTHEDPVLQQAVERLGEQAAVIIEKVRYNVLIGGTNVFYELDSTISGPARNKVSAPISKTTLQKVVRQFQRNLAKPITGIVKSTPSYGTQAINPSFIAVSHPDLEDDIRNLPGFVDAKDYGGTAMPMENEIGNWHKVRFLTTTIATPVEDAGLPDASLPADKQGKYLSTSGTNLDVYPLLIFAKDAYGIVPLKGMDAITPMVVNATPSDSDPLAQRNHVSWKAYQTAIILNDQYMCRVEVACSAL